MHRDDGCFVAGAKAALADAHADNRARVADNGLDQYPIVTGLGELKDLIRRRRQPSNLLQIDN